MLFLFNIIKILAIAIPLLVAVAYLTLVERKILGAMQKRKGPNIVGIFGLLQPLGDGVKLLFKETITPSTANKKIFIFSPILTFTLSILSWAVVPLERGIV